MRESATRLANFLQLFPRVGLEGSLRAPRAMDEYGESFIHRLLGIAPLANHSILPGTPVGIPACNT